MLFRMKPSCRIVGSLLALSMCTQANAASDTHLAVTGKLHSGACSVSFPTGESLDFGKLSVADLRPDQPTLLERFDVDLAITCPAAAALAVTIDSSTSFDGLGNMALVLGVHGSQAFSLESDGVVVGAYTAVLNPNSQQTDGGDRAFGLNRFHQGPWRSSTMFDTLTNHPLAGVQNAWSTGAGVGRYQTILSRFVVRPAINARSLLPTSADQLDLKGNMIFKLVYL